jgi:2,3-dihydroxybenzoate-AMP ligase
MTHKDIIDGWVPFTEDEVKRYVSKGFWHNLTTSDLLDRNAERFPHKLALADDQQELTWSEVKQKADRAAIWLHQAGVKYGDFFVLQTPNVVEFFYILFGLNRLGAIPIMCIPRHRKAEVNCEIGLHEARGIIVPIGEKFDYVMMVNEIKGDHPYLKIFLTVGGKAAPGWNAIKDIAEMDLEKDYPKDYLEQFKPIPDDICMEQLSGGTTGFPKGIPRTYYDYIGQWDHMFRAKGFTDESVVLDVMPVAHNSSATVVWGPMIFIGGTSVLTKHMKSKHQFELIEKRRVTFTPLVPVHLSYWMEAKELMKQYDLSSLRLVSVGAQKVKPEQARWVLEEMGINFINGFGMSEGPLISTRPESSKEAKLYSIGTPIIIDPDVQFKIVDDENQEVKRGEIGEMISKGPLTFKGYFCDPGANKKAFDEQGFFHSGDLMSIREDGRFVVEGRKKDRVIRGGENVYPEPVEDMLVKHPKIAYAAAVGMPDPGMGERLCDFVQPVEGQSFTFEEMKEYLAKAGIAVFQVLERLEVVKGWPLTGMNKINKKLLRAYITAKLLEERLIDSALGNEYLKGDNLTVEDVLSKKVEVTFCGTPS